MPMYKKSLLVLLMLILAALGGTAYGLYTREEAKPLDVATTETTQKADIKVYVTGAVNHPGIVTVEEGARAVDAVDAAGGLLPTADAEAVNMAQVLKDGQQLQVPEKETAQKQGDKQGESGGASDDGRININTADEKALDTLPGIGPAMAKRIIDYRTQNGPFQSIEDIKNVKGIGEAKFEKMKDKLRI